MFEPDDRVRVQATKPDEKNIYQVIDSITLDEDGFWRGTILLNPNLNTIVGAVSYTHLDVYKRQNVSLRSL